MKTLLKVFVSTLLAAFTLPANAALNVFACEPEWAALALALGGENVSVNSATTAQQDVHRIEAKPSLIARARNADLVVCTGGELEIGWLPLLLRQAGNPRVQPGTPGYFEAAQYVTRLDVPATVDRSQGDMHAGGNPHIQTDPRNIARIAVALTERLAVVDAANAGAHRARGADFQKRWGEAIRAWEQRAAPLKGRAIVVHHREWTYLENWLGLREVGALEPKPGIPPTPGHLTELVARLQREPAAAIVHAPYNDPRAAQFLSTRTRIPVLMLPFTVGGSERARDLFGLFDDTIARLLETIK